MKKKYQLKLAFNYYILLVICDSHMFYKYDLTIKLGERIDILIMWKLTENGKKRRNNFMSINFYFHRNNGIISKKIRI